MRRRASRGISTLASHIILLTAVVVAFSLLFVYLCSVLQNPELESWKENLEIVSITFEEGPGGKAVRVVVVNTGEVSVRIGEMFVNDMKVTDDDVAAVILRDEKNPEGIEVPFSDLKETGIKVYQVAEIVVRYDWKPGERVYVLIRSVDGVEFSSQDIAPG